MNFFCRLFGHTWVDKADDPKIRWSTAKNLSELDMTAAGEPKFYRQCARCKEKRDYTDEPRRRAS